MIRTKIICTLGPASHSVEQIGALIEEGMSVARMNFSHSTYPEHEELLNNYREACKIANKNLPVLLDMKGPEIRTGDFAEPVRLKPGSKFIIRHEDVLGTSKEMCINHKTLHEDITIGQKLLIDDGLIELTVENIENNGDIHTKVENGGTVSSKKSVNVPNVHLSLPSLTQKDRDDIAFAVKHNYDFIAISFCRNPADVLAVRRELEKIGNNDIMLIAKIENQEGIDNAEEIIKVSDGLMIARGDLGVEIPVEEVPAIQKKLIKLTVSYAKPVITATQMLDSMMRNPRPTRAEASDVANAIFDGTSCIMLSGETAVGKYPVESLKTMTNITRVSEDNVRYWSRFNNTKFDLPVTVANAISHSACTTAFDLNAQAIVTVTSSGTTARSISRFRPECPIIAPCIKEKVERQLHMSWGVIPCFNEFEPSADELFEVGASMAKETGAATDGDIVVIAAGLPVSVSGTTNMIKVHMIGDILISGVPASEGVATGPLHLTEMSEENVDDVNGAVWVLRTASDEFLPLLKNAVALIIEDNDIEGRAATAGKTLGIPVITGARGALDVLKNGVCVTVDANKGYVRYSKESK